MLDDETGHDGSGCALALIGLGQTFTLAHLLGPLLLLALLMNAVAFFARLFLVGFFARLFLNDD
jgi:hypothetical protein